MRDILESLGTPPQNPMERAQRHARREPIRRFYAEAAVAPAEAGGFAVLLDGKPIRTPAKRPLSLPSPDLAAAVAAEWSAQGAEIEPRTMPLTRLANAVVDAVAEAPGRVAEETARYAGADLVCYRAEGPERLVDRQAAAWDLVLDWVEERYGARFLVAEGVVPVLQDEEATAAIARAVAALDPWRLGALQVITSITGSVLIALALAEGRLPPDEAWTAAHVDEDWNAELWGEDAEARARAAFRRAEFDAAARVLAALRPT